MSTLKRVLLVAYQFPPVGGAGVQRVVKFVKYLPQFGWQATVLTVANPSVPVLDHSLEADIPAGTVIRKARTLEPGYAVKAAVSAGDGQATATKSLKKSIKSMVRRAANLALQPDPQVLWVPGAVKEGLKALKETPHDAIMVTGPPFSAFLVGEKLSRATGVPLLLDYRDEWGISNAYLENKRAGGFADAIQRRMQAKVVRRAKALVATTHASAEEVGRVNAKASGKASVSCIYNGYDADDFANQQPATTSADRYRLAYVGTLWKLTDVGPLVDAVLDLAQRRPDLAGALELSFAGRRTAEQVAHLDRLAGSPCRLDLHPYLDHDAAVALARSADTLCVLLSGVPEAARVVPAKVFESMAARSPVLVIAPKGEVWNLLADHPAAGLFEPSDVRGIADYLASAIEKKQQGQVANFDGYDPSRFERRQLTQQLAELLNQISS